ncbi:hypothetical protein CoNPh11_CDS0091 [Staphylococcus phage S-CoN_Ph11]|nr:hypothetical protein CoNPh11_CDS0091 [Staphylococcus phage S-CoN_Ph11]
MVRCNLGLELRAVFGWIGNKIGGSLGSSLEDELQVIWKGIKGTFHLLDWSNLD